MCLFRSKPVNIGDEAPWESSSYFYINAVRKDPVAKTSLFNK